MEYTVAGRQLEGTLAYDAAATGTRPGVLVVHEGWGRDEHARRQAVRLATAGYVAFALDMYGKGKVTHHPENAQAFMEESAGDPQVLAARFDAGLRVLKGQPQVNPTKIAVVGYCFGGTIAWLAATRIDGVAAAVGYYGGGVADAAGEQPRCPVMLHFGETDASIPKEHWEKVRAHHPKLPVHVYPAGHGFNCDERGGYHPESARLARERTIAFFRQHLG